MQAALDLATKLREAAQKRGDDAEWARGLIRETQLRMALHGYETAVRFLREQPWPEDPLPHALLDLFYAQALVTYQQAYGWEIAQREEVVSTAVPDLKQWTREQIYLEAQKAFLAAWQRRAEWGETPVTVVAEFVAPNDYPEGIRGTLRDAVSYLFAELLADSSLWEPAQSNELYRLPLDRLIAGEPGRAGRRRHRRRPRGAPAGQARRGARRPRGAGTAHAGRDEAAFEARRAAPRPPPRQLHRRRRPRQAARRARAGARRARRRAPLVVARHGTRSPSGCAATTTRRRWCGRARSR